MQIEGEIKSVIFNNPTNGYTVARLYCEDSNSDVIIVGKFLSINVGEKLKLNGKFTTNAKYGEQFVFDSFEIIYPTSISGIKTFLGSGLIKGIGPVTAKKIVDEFGTQSLEIIEFSHQKLTRINGISAKKANMIHECFYNYKNVQNIIIFLSEYNISVNMALKIYEHYKENTIKIIEENPYQLIENIDGIGFATADKIAQKFGVNQNSRFRIRAGIIYALNIACEKNGHTFISQSELFKNLEKLLNLSSKTYENIFQEVLEILILEKFIKEIFHNNEKNVMPMKYYFAEKYVADKLVKLTCEPRNSLDLSSEIAQFEKINQIKFHNEQINAIKQAINNNVCVITGGPGTGKTTIIKCIINTLEHLGKKTALLAPTGRASNRMSQTTNKEASTIHRALSMDFNSKKFAYNEHNPLDYDAVIIDEFSMVDINLANSLLRAIPNKCKVIFVGDKDQLPSVGAGNVLDDIIKSGVIDVVFLTQIFRQDENSKIITNAHLINNGEMPEIDNTSKDFFFETQNNPEKIKQSIIDLTTVRLPRYTNISPDQIQVLAPMKNGIAGVDNLNEQLQDVINPPALKKHETLVGRTILREGDKVMQTTNNYSLEWTQINNHHTPIEGTGIFNGDIGFIHSINNQTGEVEVIFENNKICVYPRTEINQLALAYAITIHKSQGSEFDVVVIPIISGPSIIINRNLIYTAITRAKNIVVLVGEKKNLAIMIRNKFVIKRNTMLKQFMIDSNKKAKTLFGE